MKSNRVEPHKEPCFRSLDELKVRVENYFEKNAMLTPWLVDHQDWHKFSPSHEVQEVVLFGNYLRDYLESGLWPFEKVRLWCLSSNVKHYIERELLHGEHQVGLINRYQLYDFSPVERKKTSSLRLVYAGRLSASKNLELLIELYHLLDLDPSIDASLDLYGDFDNEISENYGRRVHKTEFQERLKEQIKDKKWNSPPCLHGSVPAQKWLDESRDKILITLSDYYAEDFGVSVALAQEQGIPVVVSEWGGHCDVKDALAKIPAQLLSFGVEDRNILKLKAQNIKKMLLMNQPSSSSEQLQKSTPSVITSIELQLARRELTKKVGMDLIWSQRVGLDYLADQDQGALLFQRYNDGLAGKEISFECLFVVKDVDKTELGDDVVKMIKNIIEKHQIGSFHFISERYLFKKDQVELCHRAKKIIVLSDNHKLLEVLYEMFPGKVHRE